MKGGSVFRKWLVERPMLTLVVTTGLRMGFGDFCCQQIQRSAEPALEYELQRTVLFTSYGWLVNGPFLHVVYTKVYPRFADTVKGTAHKMLMSQGVVSPLSLILFYTIMPLMQGGTPQDSQN